MKNAIIVILICVIIGGGVFFIMNNREKVSEPEQATEQTTENVVYGLVTDLKSSDAIEIDVDGDVYSINIVNTTIEPDDKNIEVDDIVKITYTGDLKDNMEAEKIAIISEVTTDSETSKSSNASASEKEYYITGIIQEITMNTVTIKAVNYDNKNYTFLLEDAVKETDSEGLSEGDKVKIVHKDKLSETDKSYIAISIKKITEVKKESEKTTETNAATTETSAATTSPANTITGEVIYAAGSIIQIRTSDNQEYEFQTVGAKKEFGSEGIHTEETVEITYSGTLSTTEINQATSVILKGQ